DNTAGARYIYNFNNGRLESDTISLYQTGTLYNGNSSSFNADIETGAITTDTGTIEVFNNTVLEAWGDVTTGDLFIGDSTPITGGTYNQNYSTLNVTEQTTNSAYIGQGGLLDIKTGTVVDATIEGRLTLEGAILNKSNLNIESVINVPQIGELYVLHDGIVLIEGNTEIFDDNGHTGNVYLDGTSALNQGSLILDDTANAVLWVDGTTIIDSYGRLTNNSDGGAGIGFDATGLVTVNANGIIVSDTDSSFEFNDGLTTAGTVDLADDVDAINNSISTLAIEVTAGTTALGTSANVGDANSQDIEISGGTFTTYSDLDVTGDITITGASTVGNFENYTLPVKCQTNILGDLFILSDATMEVNCETSKDLGDLNNAVLVRSASPGGHVDVQGTLILNTNLESESMTIGDSTVGNAGTITHDTIDCETPGWCPNPEDTLNLIVTDQLTLTANSSIDVDDKVYVEATSGSGTRGGSYAGKGQYDGTGTGVVTPPYGNAGVAYTASPRSIEEYGMCGMGGSGGTRCSSLGGGIIHIYAGDTADDTGDDFITETGSLITASGESQLLGGGSGGTINIIAANSITGGAVIRAGGGASTATTGTHDTAGGGGRIYIEHWDENTFKYGSAEFTGVISAIGGLGGVNSVHGGTGTITKRWTHRWGNQKDGMIHIDPLNIATYPIDVVGDGTGTTSYDDRTYISFIASPGIEGIQAENGALVFLASGTNIQQCLDDGSADISFASFMLYNREHTPAATTTCVATPDPPGTLHINNSSTGASTQYEGEYDDTEPHIEDLTAAHSAVYYDGLFDSDEYFPDGPGGQDLNAYQLQIATNPTSLFETDSTIVSGCDLDVQGIADPGHGVRTTDIIIPWSCGQNLVPLTHYFWRIRFRENTGATDLWGLWSETNWFQIDEGGTIVLDACSGGSTFAIGTYDSSTGANFQEDWCDFDTDATTDITISVEKDGALTHSTDSDSTIWDMLSNDKDDDAGTVPSLYEMDGFDNVPSAALNEFGFYLTNVNTPPFLYASDPDFGLPGYNTGYTELESNPTQTTILSTIAGYSNESFRIWLGAFIHGLIPSSTTPPNLYCGNTYTTGPCRTRPGTYEAVFTATIAPIP
ncbi:hypothetical protein ACFLZH_00710, partial [Patescibacteria group bacterium]